MKNKKILVTIFILIMILVIGTINVKAASYNIEANKKTVEVGEKVTITVKFVAAAWNVKVSGNGITGATYASQTSDLSEVETVKTFELDTSKSGTYTITVSGDITDANGTTQDLNKSCTVTVNEKPVTPPVIEPEPPTTPEPETSTAPEQTPETPEVEETPNFTNTNKKMYASKGINLRASWSTESAATSIEEGTELTVTATSNNKVNGYIWYRVSYNGNTLYVASNLLTDTKPEPKEEPEQPVEEPKEEQTATEEPQNVEKKDEKPAEEKEGLQSLQIEGITLSPAFSSDVYEYRTIIKENVSEVVINAVPVVEGATVTIAGNTNLSEGENLITIVVYNAEGNVEATYQITLNKNTLDLSETDNWLRLGTTSARRNLMIFGIVFVVAIVALIVVMILKRKNQSYEENEEDIEEQLSTDDEQNVENTEQITVEEEQTNEEINQEETHRSRRDKRKGKHF